MNPRVAASLYWLSVPNPFSRHTATHSLLYLTRLINLIFKIICSLSEPRNAALEIQPRVFEGAVSPQCLWNRVKKAAMKTWEAWLVCLQ